MIERGIDGVVDEEESQDSENEGLGDQVQDPDGPRLEGSTIDASLPSPCPCRPPVPVPVAVPSACQFGFFCIVSWRDVKDGKVTTSWRVQCPFHKDTGDFLGSICRKSRKHSGSAEQDSILRQMKAWCLMGRHRRHRARPRERGHLGVNVLDLHLNVISN